MPAPALYTDNDGYVKPKWSTDIWKRMRVYFIRAGNLVKVGVSANVNERLKRLQANSPVPLKLEMVIVGTRYVEAAAHRIAKRKGFHRHGEWFELSPDQVLWLIDELACEGLVA